MSLFNAFQIASTGVSAQSMRLNTVASNLANAESVAGPDGQTYQARHVVFQAVAQKQAAGQSSNTAPAAVTVKQVVTDTTAARKVYDPKHPMADADGYIAMPNINPLEEMVNMISASRSYQSNIEVMNTAKTLMQKTLTLGQ